MQKIGFGLIILGVVGILGLIIWGIAEESGEAPIFIWLIIGAIVVGVLVLLAAAIRDRIKQSKTEDFKEVDR